MADCASFSSSVTRVLNGESSSRQEAAKLGVSEHQLEQLLYCFSKCVQQITDSETQENESQNCDPVIQANPNAEPDNIAQLAALGDIRSELDEFLLKTSHDLQSPSRKLIMFAEILEEELANIDIPTDAAKSLQAILNASAQMRDYLRSSIRLFRVIRHEPHFEKVSVDLVIDEAIESLGKDAEVAEAVFRRQAMPQVDTDRGLLTSVYVELLSNALKFRRESEAPEITLSFIENPANTPIIFVTEDNGIGIPEEKLRDVVAPRTRLHAPTTFPGEGIGLAFCERAIEKMGGRFWLEKGKADGVRACFTLPNRQLQ